MYKQLIIARRDLNMSPGKLAAQVSHAAMAPFTTMIRNGTSRVININPGDHREIYNTQFSIDKNLFEGWIDESFTKVICGARNKNKLLKAIEKAQALGMVEGVDYFPIVDACRTELEPESVEGTLTCVGFMPMEAKIIDQIGKEFHLF